MKSLKKILVICSLVSLMACNQEGASKLKSSASESSDFSADTETYSLNMVKADTLSAVQAEAQVEALNDQISEDLSGKTECEKRSYFNELFEEKWASLDSQRQERVKKVIVRILGGLKKLSDEERKNILKKMRPPLPSLQVLASLGIIEDNGNLPQAPACE